MALLFLSIVVLLLLSIFLTFKVFAFQSICFQCVVFQGVVFQGVVAVSGLTEHCPIFHFPPPPSSVRSSVTGLTSHFSSII